MRKVRKKKIKKVNLIVLLILILIILFFIFPRAISLARYVYNIIHEYYLSSKDFYFTSDKLGVNHIEYQVTNNWSGVETYNIIVNMSSKKNDLAYTESDIQYTIQYSCSNNISCTLSKNSGTIIGTANSGLNEDSFTISINPATGRTLINQEVAWVEVSATSTSPYTQTISGKLIVVVGSNDIYYEINDSVNNPYITVNVTNSRSTDVGIRLQYNPQVLLLDMTNSFYLNASQSNTITSNNYTYLNSVTSSVASLTTKSIKFYKIDPSQDYSFHGENNIQPVVTMTY